MYSILKVLTYIVCRRVSKIHLYENENKTKQNKDENNKYISIPFNTLLNKSTRKTFEKTNTKISYKSKNNAFGLIQMNLEKKILHSKDFKKSGIYQIKCSDCESIYIGQTRRNFECRFKEHIQAF